MIRLAEHFAAQKAAGRKLLLPFFTGGYPTMDGFSRLLLTAAAAGADGIEIGLPFSDPLADGPAIQLSSSTALSQGADIDSILTATARLAPELAIPLLLMTYVNPPLSYGLPRFASSAKAAGVSGAIFPDLPLGEEGEAARALNANGIALVRLVAPTTSDERLERIAARAEGFIYLVSVAGVTGAREQLAEGLPELVARVRRVTQLPVLIGFGIGKAQQAAEAAALADGVIVGSALIRLIEDAPDFESGLAAVASRLADMREALDAVSTAQRAEVTP